MSKNDPKITKLDKYDVEANIDEVENTDEQSVYKYGFTALSNPKNVRLSIEGIARIFGDSMERSEILEKDENGVPKILTMIYQELFPTFFLLSKTLNVSCPPHQIGTMGERLEKDVEVSDENEPSENVASENVASENVASENVASENVASENVVPQEILAEPETNIQNDSKEQTLENPDVTKPTV